MTAPAIVAPPVPARAAAALLTSLLCFGPLAVTAAPQRAALAARTAAPAREECVQPAEMACPLPLGQPVSAILWDPEHVHAWSLSLPGPRHLHVALTNLPADFDLHVYGPDGHLAGESMNEGAEDDAISLEAAPAGTYTVYVNSPRGLASDSPYLLTASGQELGPPLAPPASPDQAPPAVPTTAPAPPPASRAAISVETAGRVSSLRTLKGHSGWVQEVAPFSDGKLLASAAGDGVIKLWDLTTFAEARTIIAHRTSAEAVAVSPDGKLIASGADDGRVRLSDPPNGREVFQLDPVQGAIRCLAFSPDGRYLAVGGDDMKVRLWDLSGGERPTRPARTFDHRTTVWALAFSPNGKLLVTGSEDGTARVWDTSSNGTEVRGLRGLGPVRGVAISSDGRYVAAGSERSVGIWNLETGREVQTVEPGNATYAVAFAPGGKLVAAAVDRTIRLYETETGREVRVLQGHTASILTLAFTPDGKLLTSAGKDGTVMVWAAE